MYWNAIKETVGIVLLFFDISQSEMTNNLRPTVFVSQHIYSYLGEQRK